MRESLRRYLDSLLKCVIRRLLIVATQFTEKGWSIRWRHIMLCVSREVVKGDIGCKTIQLAIDHMVYQSWVRFYNDRCEQLLNLALANDDMELARKVAKLYKTEVDTHFEQNRLMSLANIEADSVYSEVVILAKGRVRAGYDLSKVAADQIKVGGDSISIVLPKPEIFDVIANPSDYEMYIEEGKWSHEEISTIQTNYREALKASSLESGILEKADKSGKERLELFLKALGFSYVELIQAN